MSSDTDGEIWSERAPEYKKRGGLYARVEYDDEGKPRYVSVAQDQTRRGEFRMDGSTAVHEPHNLPTVREAGEVEREYVENLPFVQAVEMDSDD